jgi:hypothetical protein
MICPTSLYIAVAFTPRKMKVLRRLYYLQHSISYTSPKLLQKKKYKKIILYFFVSKFVAWFLICQGTEVFFSGQFQTAYTYIYPHKVNYLVYCKDKYYIK